MKMALKHRYRILVSSKFFVYNGTKIEKINFSAICD